MSKTTVALIAFLTGCGAAAIAPLVIPPAHAQTTTRWEMLCVPNRARTLEGLSASLTQIGNEGGQQGWEPFSTADGIVCFKRPAP